MLQRTLFSLFILLSINILAQTEQPLRVELQMDDAYGNYHITTADTNGVLIFYEKDEPSKDGKRNWSFTRYNTQFQDVSNKTIAIETRFDEVLDYYDKAQKASYVLFYKQGKNFDYKLAKYNYANDELTVLSGVYPLRFDVNHFVAMNDEVFLGGNTFPSTGRTCLKNLFIISLCGIPACFGASHMSYDPVLIRINIASGKSKIENLNFRKDAKVVGLSPNQSNEQVDAGILNRISKRDYFLYVRNLNSDDKSEKELFLDPKSDKVLINAKGTAMSSNEKLFFGTYTLGYDSKRFFEKLGVTQGGGATENYSANGFYISKFVNSRQEFIKYYPFSKFNSLFPESDSRKEKNTGFNMIIHDVIQKDSDYIMIGDCYYPIYRTETYYNPGTGRWETRRVFVGWAFSNALVAAFDQDGRMLWNHVFEIWSPVSMDLSPKVKIMSNSGSEDIVMAYSDGKFIKSKVIQGDQIIEGQEKIPIETDYKSDRVVDYSGDIQYWYNNYFIAYGYQRIKNTKDSKKRRQVFYFNKIAYN